MNVRRRRFVFGATFVVPLLAISAACTFPDVTFIKDAADANTVADSATTDSTTTDSMSQADADVPVVLSDGGTTGEVVTVDGGTIDAAGCDAKCDCDNDGYFRTDCDAATPFDEPGAGRLGSGDCIDTDRNVHPKINAYVKSEPMEPNRGDWNCDGTIDRSVKPVGACNGLNNGISPCTGIAGEKIPSICGQPTDYYMCVGTGALTCGYVFSDSRTQLCK